MNNNYTEYETNDDRNQNLSLKEYLDNIKPYLGGNNNWWKIRFTIAINFNSSKNPEKSM